MRAIVQRWGLLVGILVLGLGCAGGDEPGSAGEELAEGELRLLDQALQPLRRDFEAAYGQTRIVTVLSSTCSHCLDSSGRLYDTAVPRLRELDIEVYIVWSAPLPADTELRARSLAEEMFWPGVHHYYDNTARVCRAFGRTMGMPPGTEAYDVYFIYGPEATWDADGTMEQEPEDFNVATALWAPTRPDHWWGDPKRYPGFRQVWISEILAAVDPDSTAGSDPPG